MTNHIAVHMDGQVGAILIDMREGRVLTPADERPEWAEGYATALLVERIGWYETRLGEHLPEDIRSPQLMSAQDLGWIAVDIEGDEVEVEASLEHRMDILAKFLGIDRDDAEQAAQFATRLATAEVEHTYATHPADGQTLEQVEGIKFQDFKQANG
jgi:hypothetical protein